MAPLRLFVVIALSAAVNGELIYPDKYTQSGDTFQSYTNKTCLTLSPASPSATIDYKTEVAGYPFLDIHSLQEPVQIEAKYSEAKPGLDHPFGDGPWTMANGLSNTFRVETFNITRSGRTESYFQQGGQRWQSLRLLNTDRSVKICGIGTRTLNQRDDVDSLPGSVESSNSLYNEIWALGARAVQQACIADGAAPTTWGVTSDGVYLHGQQSAQSALGASLANYTMSFNSKIVRGGTGWRVATSTQGFGLTLLLTSECPEHSTFLNVNRTLVPPNTLAVGYGYNLVNQTTLETGRVSYYPVDFDIKEGQWLDISTTITEQGYTVSINNQTAINIPLSDLQIMSNAQFSTGSVYTGTWGFGPYQDQIAYVKDVHVRAQNGPFLYHNPMTDESILAEYGVLSNHANREYVPERVYNGNTGLPPRDQEQEGSSAGLFAMSPAMGQAPKYASIYASYGLIDYRMLLLNSFPQYYLDTGDKEYIAKSWDRLKPGVDVLLTLVDESGLASAESLGAFFVGDNQGAAASSLLAYTLSKMATLAEVVADTDSATTWTEAATTLSKAVNQHLWNSEMGTYIASLTSLNESSFMNTAWAILSNTANTTQASSAINALSKLRLGAGYKTATTDPSSPDTNLSPNLSGFLLEALFQHARTKPHHAGTKEAISVLLNDLWSKMVTQDESYTGTSWEYLYPDGRPGLDLFTSHAHPWGGAPTYIFTEYVLGIQATKPGFAEWTFRPSLTTTGLEWVRGKVPTPRGVIEASWRVHGKEVRAEVCGPEGTKGVFSIPLLATKVLLDGEVVDNSGDDGVGVELGGGCSNMTVILERL